MLDNYRGLLFVSLFERHSSDNPERKKAKIYLSNNTCHATERRRRKIRFAFSGISGRMTFCRMTSRRTEPDLRWYLPRQKIVIANNYCNIYVPWAVVVA